MNSEAGETNNPLSEVKQTPDCTNEVQIDPEAMCDENPKEKLTKSKKARLRKRAGGLDIYLDSIHISTERHPSQLDEEPAEKKISGVIDVLHQRNKPRTLIPPSDYIIVQNAQSATILVSMSEHEGVPRIIRIATHHLRISLMSSVHTLNAYIKAPPRADLEGVFQLKDKGMLFHDATADDECVTHSRLPACTEIGLLVGRDIQKQQVKFLDGGDLKEKRLHQKHYDKINMTDFVPIRIYKNLFSPGSWVFNDLSGDMHVSVNNGHIAIPRELIQETDLLPEAMRVLPQQELVPIALEYWKEPPILTNVELQKGDRDGIEIALKVRALAAMAENIFMREKMMATTTTVDMTLPVDNGDSEEVSVVLKIPKGDEDENAWKLKLAEVKKNFQINTKVHLQVLTRKKGAKKDHIPLEPTMVGGTLASIDTTSSPPQLLFQVHKSLLKVLRSSPLLRQKLFLHAPEDFKPDFVQMLTDRFDPNAFYQIAIGEAKNGDRDKVIRTMIGMKGEKVEKLKYNKEVHQKINEYKKGEVLNKEQFEVLERALFGDDPILNVAAPPGVGKTTTISVISALLDKFINEEGMLMVLAATTNAALTQIVNKLAGIFSQDPKEWPEDQLLLRAKSYYQSEEKETVQWEDRTISTWIARNAEYIAEKKDNKELVNDVYAYLNTHKEENGATEALCQLETHGCTEHEANIKVDYVALFKEIATSTRKPIRMLGATVGTLMRNTKLLQQFPKILLVQDEGGAVAELAIDELGWRSPICKIISFGDTRQTSPSAQCKKSFITMPLRQSIMDILENSNKDSVMTLNRCYRLPPLICQAVSFAYYDGKLVSAVDPAHTSKLARLCTLSEPRIPIFLVNAKGSSVKDELSPSSLNAHQQVVGLQAQQTFERLGLRTQILTIYAADAREARATLAAQQSEAQRRVSTVDAFLGKEEQIIIVLTNKTDEEARYNNFLGDRRRANVSLTRSLQGLVVVGDMENLPFNAAFSDFFFYLKQIHVQVHSVKDFFSAIQTPPEHLQVFPTTELPDLSQNQW